MIDDLFFFIFWGYNMISLKIYKRRIDFNSFVLILVTLIDYLWVYLIIQNWSILLIIIDLVLPKTGFKFHIWNWWFFSLILFFINLIIFIRIFYDCTLLIAFINLLIFIFLNNLFLICQLLWLYFQLLLSFFQNTIPVNCIWLIPFFVLSMMRLPF